MGLRRRARRKAENVVLLRQAVDRLPMAARVAMLRGISRERIVAGAYTDSRGGLCPLLSAHRHGGRCESADFAAAWDRFTGARRRVRPANGRELAALRTILLASIEATRARVTPGGPAWLRPVRSYEAFVAAIAAVGQEAAIELNCMRDTLPGEVDVTALVMALDAEAERS